MQFDCIGETVTESVQAYNVQGYTEGGTMLFAEIDYNSGKLVRFDFFEDCNEETFDYENAERIAVQFLEKLGYEDMQAMRITPNGTDADFLFVYTNDDVAFYPDTVKVKVCRTRGLVTSFDATKYLKNHKDREEPEVKISLASARDQLHEALDVQSARLTVVQTVRGERPAYEFLCAYDGQQYLIYTDAISGAEIAIVNVKNAG
jgi:spore germination protein